MLWHGKLLRFDLSYSNVYVISKMKFPLILLKPKLQSGQKVDQVYMIIIMVSAKCDIRMYSLVYNTLLPFFYWYRVAGIIGRYVYDFCFELVVS